MATKKLKILGYDYSLRATPPIDSGGMEQAGRLIIGKQLMYYDPTQNQQSQESAILYEIIEALNYHLETSLPHQTIMSLEAGLYQALTSNGVDLSVLIKR
jgi:hypothetical protein